MKIGILGCGVMGSAFAKQMVQHHDVHIFDRSKEAVTSLKIEAHACADLKEFCSHSEVIVLAIKPKDLENTANSLDPYLTKDHVLISILAGTDLDRLKQNFPKSQIVWLMPNLPLLSGEGMLGVVETKEMPDALKSTVSDALQGLGKMTFFPESLMNGFTALTGSCPAFIYVIIEAMVAAGISFGFSAKESYDYVLQTFKGSIKLLEESGLSPQELYYKISSPGGTTICGIHEMEKQKVRAGILETLKKTKEKADSMEKGGGCSCKECSCGK